MTSTPQPTLTELLQRIQTALKAATLVCQDDYDPANLPAELESEFYHLVAEIEAVRAGASPSQSSDTDRNPAPESPRP